MVSLQAALAAIALSGVGQTVMLDFYADWCGPCKAMNPTVQALVAAGYPVQRVNIDQNRPLAAKYRVQSIPCFVMVVDGREVDRVVGGTTFSRLERLCKAGAATTPLSAPFEGWGNPPVAGNSPLLPGEGPGVRAAVVTDATLLAASVRLRVEDPGGHSCGSGTIIDARSGQALILTCGHIFRDSQGKGQIEVDLFGPGGPQRIPGRLVSYDSEKRDVGLVVIQAPGPLVTARVAPPGYRIAPGMPVVSVGCNNGDAPTARHSQINSLDKFTGPPNIQVAGQPVEGRSGGGLFSSDGYVLGVCNAADPSDKEGLFAALGSIYAELDRAEVAFVYKSQSENPVAMPPAANPAAVAANPLPAMPAQMPGAVEPTSFSEPPAALPPQEQAALEEIHRRVKEGAEVTIVVHPRNDPNAKSEVFMLDHASREFVSQLSAETRRRETSLEVPKPRKVVQEAPKPRRILLEWSADDEKTEAGSRQPEIMDASPRISPTNTIMR